LSSEFNPVSAGTDVTVLNIVTFSFFFQRETMGDMWIAMRMAYPSCQFPSSIEAQNKRSWQQNNNKPSVQKKLAKQLSTER
jgi:hypothetical protein